MFAIVVLSWHSLLWIYMHVCMCIAPPNPTQRFVQLAVRNSWLTSLLARLARVMGLGSHLPGHCSSKVSEAGGRGSCTCLVVTCGFGMIDSDRESGAAALRRCRRCSVQNWQPARTGIVYLVCTHYYAQVLKKKREEEHEEQPSHEERH
jgi:hypothetical protein